MSREIFSLLLKLEKHNDGSFASFYFTLKTKLGYIPIISDKLLKWIIRDVITYMINVSHCK